MHQRKRDVPVTDAIEGSDPYWKFRGGSFYTRSQRQIACYTVGLKCLKSGRTKIVGFGHPSYHLQDWRGANSHWVTFPGQPFKGFEDTESALSWLFSNYRTEDEALRVVNDLGKVGAWTTGSGILFVDFKARKAY